MPVDPLRDVCHRQVAQGPGPRPRSGIAAGSRPGSATSRRAGTARPWVIRSCPMCRPACRCPPAWPRRRGPSRRSCPGRGFPARQGCTHPGRSPRPPAPRCARPRGSPLQVRVPCRPTRPRSRSPAVRRSRRSRPTARPGRSHTSRTGQPRAAARPCPPGGTPRRWKATAPPGRRVRRRPAPSRPRSPGTGSPTVPTSTSGPSRTRAGQPGPAPRPPGRERPPTRTKHRVQRRWRRERQGWPYRQPGHSPGGCAQQGTNVSAT